MPSVLAEVVPDFVSNTPLWLALLTTAVAATQGAALGRAHNVGVAVDFVGMAVFALMFGLAGSWARDVMLGNTPFVSLRTPWFVLTVLGGVLLVLVVGRWIPVEGSVFVTLDALTLSLYAAIGTQDALDFGVPAVGASLVGVVAATTGGVVVALMLGQTPAILLSGPPYAVLGFIGTVAYLALAPIDRGIASFACVALVIALRWVTLRFGINTSPVVPPHDLTGPVDQI